MLYGEVKDGNKQGEEDYQAEENINDGLPPWRKEPIEDIYSYMSLETKGISRSHHKESSIEIIGEIVSPQRGLVKYIPHYGRVNHADYQDDDKPTKTLRHPLIKKVNVLQIAPENFQLIPFLGNTTPGGGGGVA